MRERERERERELFYDGSRLDTVFFFIHPSLVDEGRILLITTHTRVFHIYAKLYRILFRKHV